jgi:methionyl-tRNA formyltransferase
MKIVLVSQVPQAAQGYADMLRGLGHEPVALLASRAHAGRYGNRFDELVREAPAELDVLIPASRERIAPLLRPYEPDLALCTGFPWKVPVAALSVPRYGWMNGHPSLLPHYRGASPVSWAIRNGERELGFTFHRMDAELDTGAILAQGTIELGDEHSWEELEPKLVDLIVELLPKALARIEAGDPGDPQQGEGSYFSFFGPDYVWIDWSRPAEEIFRQVQAWRFASATDGERGALAELDGRTVRVLRTSLAARNGSRALETGDGTIWVLETEPA